MEYVVKPVGGAIIGVAIPIVVEYAAKGKRVSDQIPVKWSGIAGLVEGAVGIIPPVLSETGTAFKGMKDEDKALLAALGGAGVATGVSIIILDELRKRAMYEFKRGGAPSRIPLTEQGYPMMQERTPTAPLVEEI